MVCEVASAAVKNVLQYPFAGDAPLIGDSSTVEVNDNLLWARMPVGGGLVSVNTVSYTHLTLPTIVGV